MSIWAETENHDLKGKEREAEGREGIGMRYISVGGAEGRTEHQTLKRF